MLMQIQRVNYKTYLSFFLYCLRYTSATRFDFFKPLKSVVSEIKLSLQFADETFYIVMTFLVCRQTNNFLKIVLTFSFC